MQPTAPSPNNEEEPVPVHTMNVDAGLPPLAPEYFLRCPQIMYGQWKDGFCDLCAPGSRPAICMAFWGPCCWPCLFAKIMSRLRWNPGCRFFGNTPFKQWLVMLSGLMLVMWICWISQTIIRGSITAVILEDMQQHPTMHPDMSNQYIPSQKAQAIINEKNETDEGLDTILTLGGLVFTCLICLMRLRIRTKYLIPSNCDSSGSPVSAMGIFEDGVLAWCCECCTLAQMARHVHAVAPDTGICAGPCDDPGPAEITQPAFANSGFIGQQQQMQTFQVHPNSMYVGTGGMYGGNPAPPIAVPMAEPIVPVASVCDADQAPAVLQGRPVDQTTASSSEVYSGHRV